MHSLLNNHIKLFLNFALMAFTISLLCKTLSMHSHNGVETLHKVIRAKHIQFVQTLLTKKNVNNFDDDGYTALHIAAETGNPEILDLVLAAGAEIDETTQNNRWTALHIATALGHEDVTARLLAAGATVNPIAYATKEDLAKVAPQPQDNDEDENPSTTPLHLAILREHLPITKQLLAAEAYVHTRGADYNDTPLHSATYTNNSKFAALLLDNGALASATNPSGRMALHSAVTNNVSTNVIDLLIPDPLQNSPLGN